jgi:hypothetical protein
MNFFARPFYLKNDLKGKMKITLFFISYMVARTILKHHCFSLNFGQNPFLIGIAFLIS